MTRRALTCAGLTLTSLLFEAATAFAAAGSGSSGFSGGGGGGGGGFSGGGGSSGGGNVGGSTGGFVVVVIVIAWVVFTLVAGWWAARKYRKRRRTRDTRVRTAAAEALEDDVYFDPATVDVEAAALFHACQEAWDAVDHDRLRTLIGADLLKEWELRLHDFEMKGWRNEVTVRNGPAVEYVGLVNRDDDAEDRIVVRLEATLRDVVITDTGETRFREGAKAEVVAVAEYWTLARREDRWICVSIETDAEGAHHLDDPIVASPWSDTERLRDDAYVEGAIEEAAPEGVKTSDIADLDFDGDARAAANDLSLADGRFAPHVLEAAARRAVVAWAEAVDGEDGPLEAVATPAAVQELLYPADAGANARLVVRGPKVLALRIVALDAATDPPTMTVEVDVSGRRYVENRDTVLLLSGSRDRSVTFTERWVFALDGVDDTPWRVSRAAVGAGA